MMRFLVGLCFLLLCSCGSGSSGATDVSPEIVAAPAALTGESYLGTVAGGSGAFATTGTFTIDFTTVSSYIITGDGVDTIDSSGTYTYASSGTTGTVSLNDGTLGSFGIVLEFTAVDAGTYTADAGGGHTQNGSFAASSTLLAPTGNN